MLQCLWPSGLVERDVGSLVLLWAFRWLDSVAVKNLDDGIVWRFRVGGMAMQTAFYGYLDKLFQD